MTHPSTRSSRWLGRRQLLRIGPVAVSSYAAMLYVGFALGVPAGATVAALDHLRFAAAAVLLLAPALIGGRLWYLLGHRRRRSGGAGLYGGLVLSFVASWPVVELTGLPFWRFWDGAAVLLLIGMTVTRLGCLMTGCCAGRRTSGRCGMVLPDSAGEWQRRYPTQLLEAAVTATILAVAVWLYHPSASAGVLFFGAAAAYGCGRISLELLRADAALTARATRMNLAFSALLALGSLLGLLLAVR